jgi:predicted nucleic acid-binding protein
MRCSALAVTVERPVKTYVDASALVAVYVPETFSDAARRAVQDTGPVPFTALHRIEVLNAFEVLVGRRLITRQECRAILGHLQEDVSSRRLVDTVLDLDGALADAVVLSRQYAAKFLTRTLDLIHVAVAQALSSAVFVSADDRQLAVAKATGLRTVDIKGRPRRPRR